MKLNLASSLTVIIVVFFSACQLGGEVGLPAAPEQNTSTLPGPSLTPTTTHSPTPAPTPTATPVVILDPDPITIEFQAADGVWLSGSYYPADVNPAPVIVLMPWARGDKSDWHEIALWLQARGLLEPIPDYNHSWKSAPSFPANTLDRSIAVFTFTFRECEGGCQAYLPGDWLKDVEGALTAAVNLHGVALDQILTAGASIGADGALYGCHWLNVGEQGVCRGSFMLSPASFLTIPFDALVEDMLGQEPPPQIYCLFGLRDDASVETCQDYPGITVVDYGYIENHGMEIIQFERAPNPLDLLQEFISSALPVE
jgi:hypothetical protein